MSKTPRTPQAPKTRAWTPKQEQQQPKTLRAPRKTHKPKHKPTWQTLDES